MDIVDRRHQDLYDYLACTFEQEAGNVSVHIEGNRTAVPAERPLRLAQKAVHLVLSPPSSPPDTHDSLDDCLQTGLDGHHAALLCAL